MRFASSIAKGTIWLWYSDAVNVLPPLEEWHDHSRSDHYQKCAGDRLAETQVTVSRAIHVLSTEDQPRQLVSQRDGTCRNLEMEEKPAFGLLLRTWQPYMSPLRSWRVFVPNAVFLPGKTLSHPWDSLKTSVPKFLSLGNVVGVFNATSLAPLVTRRWKFAELFKFNNAYLSFG